MAGRRLGGRPDELPLPQHRPPPPGPPRPAARTPRPAGPLVADREPMPPPQGPEAGPAGRFRRFARRYGWRAYAVPVLAAVTVVTLVDLTSADPAVPGRDAGQEVGTTVADGQPPAVASPAPTSLPSGAAADVVPPADADADAVPPTDAGPTGASVPAPEDFVQLGQGGVSVVDGSSDVLGSGPLRRFAVEVENGIEVDAQAFARAVEDTLGNPRSWGNGGRMSFQRVGREAVAAGKYDFKVSLISPGSMETYCPGVGTGGYTSCRYGERAVINLARWATAVPHYDGDIATYRHYVVNHEVGHALGNSGHPRCPGPGQLAPVMQQQTLDLQGCRKNAWPYP